MSEKLDKMIEDLVEKPKPAAAFVETPEEEDELDSLEDELDKESEPGDDDEDEGAEDELDDAEDDDDEAEPVAAPKKQRLSKETAKIVEQRREIKQLRDRLKSLESNAGKAPAANPDKERLVEGLTSKGYTADNAEVMADTMLELGSVKEQVKLLRFTVQNKDILERYPESADDIVEIMGIAERTGKPVARICRGLYGEEKPVASSRNRTASAKQEASQAADIASKTSMASRGKSTVVLTAEERKAKRRLESITGFEISNERFKEITK